MKSGRWDTIEQAQSQLAHLEQDIAQRTYGLNDRAESNRDMRNFIRGLYFYAVEEGRHAEGVYDPKHTMWEKTFYRAVGVFAKHGYKPARLKGWLSEQYMLEDDYLPPRSGIAHITDQPIGYREKLMSKVYWLRHDYTMKTYNLRTPEAPLPCIDPYVDLLKMAQHTILEICPDQQRKKRIDNNLDNLNHKYRIDRAYKNKNRNIFKLN